MAFNQPEEYILLSTKTASNSANLAFTSLITSTYPVYYVKIRSVVPITDNVNLNMVFSTDNGATYLNSAYGWSTQVQYAGAGGTGIFVNNSTNLNASLITLQDSLSNVSTRFTSVNLYLFNLATTNVPLMQGTAIKYDHFGNMGQYFITGINTGTTAINAIQFAMSSGNISSGTISLYGMTI